MKRLIRYAKPYSVHIIMAALASVGCSVVNVWLIDVLKQVIDKTIAGEIKQVLPWLIVKILSVILLGLLSNYLVVAMTGLFGAGILRDLRRDSLKAVMNTSPDFMEKNNFGDIMERLSSDIDGIAGYMKDYFKECIYVPVIVVVFAVYLMGMNLWLAFTCLFPLAVLVPLSICLLKPVKVSQFEYVKMLGMTNNNIQEAFDAADIIKSYNLQDKMEEKYYDALKETFDISNKNDLRQYNIEPVSAMIREVPRAIAVCVGGYLVLRGNMTMGAMIAFLSAIQKINEPLVRAYQLVVRTQMAMISVNRVFYVLDMPAEKNDGIKEVDRRGENAFVLKNVSFAYHNTEKKEEKNVIEDFSLTIRKGEKIALVGKSGSGKSTIIKLLSRQYETGYGDILYYGHRYEDIAPECVRKDMALISQDAVIFPMSISDNIRIGNPDASREEIIRAAKIAGCHNFIENMENGYDSLIEEKGNNLSGGQKQRISIARAVLKDAEILLLDEPTSALDKETEKYISEAIAKISRNKTVVTVAHRLSTITDYDRIIVMEEGKIIESGTHKELMDRNGSYQKMYEEYMVSGGVA